LFPLFCRSAFSFLPPLRLPLRGTCALPPFMPSISVLVRVPEVRRHNLFFFRSPPVIRLKPPLPARVLLIWSPLISGFEVFPSPHNTGRDPTPLFFSLHPPKRRSFSPNKTTCSQERSSPLPQRPAGPLRCLLLLGLDSWNGSCLPTRSPSPPSLFRRGTPASLLASVREEILYSPPQFYPPRPPSFRIFPQFCPKSSNAPTPVSKLTFDAPFFVRPAFFSPTTTPHPPPGEVVIRLPPRSCPCPP